MTLEGGNVWIDGEGHPADWVVGPQYVEICSPGGDMVATVPISDLLAIADRIKKEIDGKEKTDTGSPSKARKA